MSTTANIKTSFHADDETEIRRNPPAPGAPGGWVTLSGPNGVGADVTIFPPRQDAAEFWLYLSNVASDMATYCEVKAARS